MIISIDKKQGESLIIDTNKIRCFKESGIGYDITFGKDTYYFSIGDVKYMLSKLNLI